METPEPVPVLTPVPDNGLGLGRHALVCLLSILLSILLHLRICHVQRLLHDSLCVLLAYVSDIHACNPVHKLRHSSLQCCFLHKLQRHFHHSSFNLSVHLTIL